MKKLLALPFLVPLVVSGGPPLAAALWVPAIAVLPLTFIVSLAARKPPWTTVFFLNLVVVVVIGFIGAGTNLPGPGDLDGGNRTPIESPSPGNGPAHGR